MAGFRFTETLMVSPLTRILPCDLASKFRPSCFHGNVYQMFSSAVKDWVSVLAPSLSVLAAITALGLSARLAYAQRRIQEGQLKQSLYDKRYAVFLAVEEFLMHVLRENGSVKLLGEEFRRFRYALEQAEFLFKTDVTNYMKQLDKTVQYLYAKAFTRDHLAAANQNDPQLDLEITNVLMELGGPFIERRKMVFGPYLQLSPSEIEEGSAAPMKLNGWQRLWVVVAVAWILPVLILSYELWPTTANISKGDVYTRMKPDDGHRLTDYYDVVATQLGWTNMVTPRIAELQQDKGFLAASTKDQKAYLSHIDPDFAKASSLDQNAYLGHITGITGPTVDIDGHTVQFIRDIPQEDMNQTARAYHAALRQILTRKRTALVGEEFALWMLPTISLYALGWAIRWVRRGFSTPTM
jgi:hypothetical protein